MSVPLRIALIYAAVGCVWIVGTDALVNALAPPEAAAALQTVKGWLFVGLSAALVYILVEWYRLARDQEAERAQLLGEELAMAQEVAGMAHWSLDPGTGAFHWSGAAARIFGVPPGRFYLDADVVRSFLHDDDRKRVNQAVDEAMETGGPVEITHRILRPDGEVRWIRATMVRVTRGARDESQLLGTIQDVTEPTLAQERLREALAQLNALSAHLQDAREEERRQISMDMHDVIGGNLAGIRMAVNRLHDDPRAADVRELTELIDDGLQETLRAVRNLAREIRPGILDELGLAAALEWMVRDLQEAFDGTLTLETDVEKAVNLPPERAIHVFRVAQEALTNALRHGHPSTVRVELQAEKDEVVLRVEDDGRGFDPGQGPRGLGTLNMRERGWILGGEVELDSTPGEGSTVVLRLPGAAPTPEPVRHEVAT